ncbi:MAG: dihydrofolate reductase [Bacteriovorax sp.]
MIVSMIVAMGPKREIGFNNKLLWHIPEDLKNFKKLTTGKTMVMGRKTFESIGRPLPNRKSIVLTRDSHFHFSGVDVIHDPLMAFDLALEHDETEESELMVIGGEEIFKLYMPYVQKIYLSEVDYSGPADAYFPALQGEWREVESQKFEQFQYRVLERVS